MQNPPVNYKKLVSPEKEAAGTLRWTESVLEDLMQQIDTKLTQLHDLQDRMLIAEKDVKLAKAAVAAAGWDGKVRSK